VKLRLSHQGTAYIEGVSEQERIIRGPKKENVTGVWRKLRIAELRNLHSSPNTLVLSNQEGW
jgi:hypothetical protein